MADLLVINWHLPMLEFMKRIDEFIDDSVQKELNITLPIVIADFAILPPRIRHDMLFGALDCAKCGAECCRDIGPIRISEREVKRLRKKGAQIKTDVRGPYLESPCTFLSNKGRCHIYPIRPFVCTYYPYNDTGKAATGEALFALDPDCRQAAKLARLHYKMVYITRISRRPLTVGSK